MIATRYLERSVRAVPEVACVWTQSLPPGAGPYDQRVVPDGCIDVIWWASSGRLEVAGPDTVPFLARLAPGDRLVGVRFRPGRAPAALGVPADAIRDEHLPLRELWGREADALAEALAEAAAPGRVLLSEARRCLRAAGPPDPVVGVLPAVLEETLSVRDAAARLGFGERQLRRRSLAAFGYSPKVLQRVLRFQRALSLARAGAPIADVAQVAGYADQPHLAHEVLQLAGVPLGTLIARK